MRGDQEVINCIIDKGMVTIGGFGICGCIVTLLYLFWYVVWCGLTLRKGRD
jgi:hypothetical protein